MVIVLKKLQFNSTTIPTYINIIFSFHLKTEISTEKVCIRLRRERTKQTKPVSTNYEIRMQITKVECIIMYFVPIYLSSLKSIVQFAIFCFEHRFLKNERKKISTMNNFRMILDNQKFLKSFSQMILRTLSSETHQSTWMVHWLTNPDTKLFPNY